jgi:DNA polymerase-3 subunit delta'
MILPWQDSARAHIEKLLAAERLPHALLVRGPEGWGDVCFANWLAFRLLELSDPTTDAEPLDVAARELAHPDLRWVVPEGAVIKVDDVRMLADFAIGTRQSAPRKVAVIERAHLMNTNAANALLKTLEEPPAGTHLILTTSQPGQLLPTIVSRCQSVLLKADEEAARTWLRQRWDDEIVESRLSEYGRAPLACDEGLREGEAALLPILGAIAAASHPTRAAEQLLELDTDRLLARWYRHCVALAAGQVNESWAASIPARRLAFFVDELIRTRRQLLSSNSANARLLLERLAVNWTRMCGSSG